MESDLRCKRDSKEMAVLLVAVGLFRSACGSHRSAILPKSHKGQIILFVFHLFGERNTEKKYESLKRGFLQLNEKLTQGSKPGH